MTTCPCCGAETAGEVWGACAECGARPVGPPLARPERELPSYGRAFLLSAAGALLALSFAAAVLAALLRRETFVLGFDSLWRAAESAAWRLKWTALPLSCVASAVGLKLFARMRREPARFVGHAHARAGLALTVAVALTLTALVGVTVPERLRMRELARRSAENALLYQTDLALARYRKRFGTYPAALTDLVRLEDPDGSIARLLSVVAPGEYKPETDVASLSAGRTKARGRRRVSALAARAAGADDSSSGPVIALTNYALVLPGRDRVLGTGDDLYIRDGRILDAAPSAAGGNLSVAATPTPAGARAH